MDEIPPKEIPQKKDEPQPPAPLPFEESQAAPAPKEKPFQRGSRVTRAFRQARQFLLGSKVASPFEETLRKQLIPFTTKASITKKFIEQNLSTLTDLSKNNEQIADLLKHLEEPKYQKAIDNITKKLIQGEEVFAEEMKDIVGYFDGISSSFEDVGVQLHLALPVLLKSFQEILTNNQIDLKDRRDALNTLVKILDGQKIQNDAVEKLRAISQDQLNFSDEQVSQITALTDGLLTDKEIHDKKLFGTFNELNKKLGSILFNVKEWREFTEKEEEDRTVREHLQQGLGAIPGGIKAGLMDALLAAVGLPGLGVLLREVGLPGMSVFIKAIKGLINFIPELFEGSGILSKAVTGLIDGFTDVVAPLAVFGSALYGAYEGIKATWDEWKKLGKGIVDFSESLFHYLGKIIDSFAKTSPLLEKVVDGVESVIKNILDLPVLILKMIAEGWKDIFTSLGFGAGKLGGLFEDWAKKLDASGVATPPLPEKPGTTGVEKQVAVVTGTPPTAAPPTSPTKSVSAALESIIPGLTTPAPAEGLQATPLAGSKSWAKPTQTPVELNTQSQALAAKEQVDQRAFQQRVVENTQKPIIVQSPPPAPPPAPAPRKNTVDDLGTALNSLGLAGY